MSKQPSQTPAELPKPERLSQIVDHCISIAKNHNLNIDDIVEHCGIGAVPASQIMHGQFKGIRFELVNRFVAGMLGKLPKKMF